MIWAITIVLVSVLAIVYAFLKMTEEANQALAEAGDDYQVIDEKTGQIVYSCSTDWQAEAYIDDHTASSYAAECFGKPEASSYDGILYISLPEDRYYAALAAIRKAKQGC